MKAWVKWLYETPRELKGVYPAKNYQAVRDLSIYNCSDRNSITLQSTRYSDIEMTDVVQDVSIKDVAGDYSEVAPDTIGEALLEYACKETRASAKK